MRIVLKEKSDGSFKRIERADKQERKQQRRQKEQRRQWQLNAAY